MKELKKHQFLLSVVALLIIIKWLYVPIVDWQDERYFEIKQKQNRLSKSSAVLKQSNVYSQKNDLLAFI